MKIYIFFLKIASEKNCSTSMSVAIKVHSIAILRIQNANTAHTVSMNLIRFQ